MNKDNLLRLTFLGWDLRRNQEKICGDGNRNYEFPKLNHSSFMCRELLYGVIEWFGAAARRQTLVGGRGILI